MKNIRKALLLCLTLIFILPVLVWANETPVMIRGIRPLGMGGAFTAIADDQNAFFYNAAGLTQIPKWQVNIANIPVIVSNDTFEMYKWIKDHNDQLKNFDTQDNATRTSLINDIQDNISKLRVHVSGSILNPNFISSPMGLTNNLKLTWGFGLFDVYDVNVRLNSSLLVPSVDTTGSIDSATLIPVAVKMEKIPFDLPGSLSLAGTFKFINRGKIEELRKSVLEFDNFSPAPQFGGGHGLDISSLYQYNEYLNFGLMVSDFGGTVIKYDAINPNTTDKAHFFGMGFNVDRNDKVIAKPAVENVIAPRVNVGVAYRPQNFYYWKNKFLPLTRHFVFALDLNDITSSTEKLTGASFFKKVHAGGEYQTKMLSLRGGFNSGYPSFGVGLNLWLVKLDYAFYGDELGRYAGQIVEWNHAISASIGF